MIRRMKGESSVEREYRIRLVHVQLRPWVFKAATATKIYWSWGVLWHRIDAKISLKAALEKAQTTVSKNRCTSPMIDVFRTDILMLLAPTGDNALMSFFVHRVPCISATVVRYHQMFTQFYFHIWASKYTCRPMIANLLYPSVVQFSSLLCWAEKLVPTWLFYPSWTRYNFYG